jgi:hypothetical protein
MSWFVRILPLRFIDSVLHERRHDPIPGQRRMHAIRRELRRQAAAGILHRRVKVHVHGAD